jgi:hypothetical protein
MAVLSMTKRSRGVAVFIAKNAKAAIASEPVMRIFRFVVPAVRTSSKSAWLLRYKSKPMAVATSAHTTGSSSVIVLSMVTPPSSRDVPC